jgi:hypothetical protein
MPLSARTAGLTPSAPGGSTDVVTSGWRTPASSVSAVLRALPAQVLVDDQRRARTPDLFWALAASWRPQRYCLRGCPDPTGPDDDWSYELGCTDLDIPGWALGATDGRCGRPSESARWRSADVAHSRPSRHAGYWRRGTRQPCRCRRVTTLRGWFPASPPPPTDNRNRTDAAPLDSAERGALLCLSRRGGRRSSRPVSVAGLQGLQPFGGTVFG